LQLINARKNLGDEVNQEVAELKTLISSNEELVRATATTLKDKEEHVQIMQDELNNTRVKSRIYSGEDRTAYKQIGYLHYI